MPKTKTASPVLNPTAASLLGFLHEKPMTGSKLLRTAEERIGNFWSLTTSQVYAELDKLAKHGYITASERGQRASRAFTLQEKGRQAFQEWVLREPGPELIRFPLLLSVTFSSHIDSAQMLGFLESHAYTHKQRLAKYKKLRRSLRLFGSKPESLLTLDFGIAYEQLVLDWLKRANQTIGKRK